MFDLVNQPPEISFRARNPVFSVTLFLSLTSLGFCEQGTTLNLFQASKRSEVISSNNGGFSNLNFFDDQLCLASYDVSERSIIRTKDSLANGARYINVTELGASSKAKDECLRLCCRTPKCNVVTYEEKQAGSCYLFDCGSIENFLCKFTDQSQFVSAILRKREDSLFLPQLQQAQQQQQQPARESQNRHEVELSQLRNMEADNKGIPAGETSMKLKILNSHEAEITGLTTVPSSILTVDGIESGHSHRCSRYQFECKSSGECIAIYNACDGIQQCPDGSDETTPELRCPSVAESLGISPSKAVAQHQGRGGSSSSSGSSSASFPVSGGKSGGSSQPQQLQDFRLTQTSNLAPPQQQQARQQQGTNYVTNGNGHAEKLSFETIPRPPSPGNNMIFNHKDGGIMDDTYGNQLQQQRQNPFSYWKSYDYGIGEIPPNGYGQSGSGNNPSNYAGANGGPVYSNAPAPPYSYPGYSGGVPPPPQPMPPYNSNSLPQGARPPYYNHLQPPNPPNNNEPKPNPVYANPPSQQLPQQTTTTLKPSAAPPSLPTKGTTVKSPIDLNSSSPVSPNHHESKSEHREDQILQSLLSKASFNVPKLGEDTDDFSESDSPGFGAVLVFIMGLGMSIIMVVVVTCRLRRIKMGTRRRGKNRLDPDYLVDGMYL